jgi:hypothetical protein
VRRRFKVAPPVPSDIRADNNPDPAWRVERDIIDAGSPGMGPRSGVKSPTTDDERDSGERLRGRQLRKSSHQTSNSGSSRGDGDDSHILPNGRPVTNGTTTSAATAALNTPNKADNSDARNLASSYSATVTASVENMTASRPPQTLRHRKRLSAFTPSRSRSVGSAAGRGAAGDAVSPTPSSVDAMSIRSAAGAVGGGAAGNLSVSGSSTSGWLAGRMSKKEKRVSTPSSMRSFALT